MDGRKSEKAEENKSQLACVECGSFNLIYDPKEVVCGDCATVQPGKELDRGFERRAFDSEQRKKRTRTADQLTYSIHDKGLSTVIDYRNVDARNKRIGKTDGERLDFYKMRKWQKRIRVMDVGERSLANSLGELNRLVDVLGLPKVLLESSSVRLRKFIETGKNRGTSTIDFTAAAVHYECRQRKIPRTFKEIAEAASIDKRRLYRAYKKLMEELGLENPGQLQVNYVAKYSNKLREHGVSDIGTAERIAIKIVDLAKKYGVAGGKTDEAIAAASLYIACILFFQKRRVTQGDLANISGLTEVTVRNRYKNIIESDKLVNELYGIVEQENIKKSRLEGLKAEVDDRRKEYENPLKIS